ncbi:chemotaxis protein [Rhizobium petrolearium]|uniref:Chemotaxis protein MotC n=1 Tax=Neorhizobium petrolearium TaxID=515361 RepID=A0ABY8M2T2_9HYPH|nr:chemotaxis protein MotC [Neorhizobium petrolearium]MCC2608534.1 chemotaxis protein [Neorhizobium petrolearium]WGI68802.1 chemotaxis protein MotC [Neorhizobium petrolearium]
MATTLVFGAAFAYPASAQDHGELAPYVMLRSLQFVQDSVVLGDHSAAEMQRFMLERVDQRFRAANPSIFEDPRNVDAALIYAMSGGNPATLEFLAARDIAGNFDSRIADALRKYLSGKGTLVAKSLGEMAKEYRDEKIGPYLSLVSGNVMVATDPKDALVFYDWARLTAPGTIIEEAALRRSVAITVDADMVEQALSYARKYARRFIHSPYASQFADFFVQLVVGHFGEITEEDIDGALEFMDVDRRREVFLRVARAAAIAGKNDLARLASAKVEALSGNPTPEALARLYGGLADIPTNDIRAAMQAISDIPEETLSPRDRALREAAKVVAEQVVGWPTAESLAQEKPINMTNTEDAKSPVASPRNEIAGPAATTEGPTAGAAAKFDPAFQTYVDSGRSKLNAIDEMLKEENPSK